MIAINPTLLEMASATQAADLTSGIDGIVRAASEGRLSTAVEIAVLLTVLPELLRGFADYRMILYSLLIIGLMLTRPQGLFNFQRRERPDRAAN